MLYRETNQLKNWTHFFHYYYVSNYAIFWKVSAPWHNNPNQTKSNWINKSPGLIDTNASGWLSRPREETWKETGKPRVYSLKDRWNMLWEWFWASLGRGHHFGSYLGGGVWTRQLKGRDLEVDPPAEHSRLFGYMDVMGWGETSSQIFQTHFKYMDAKGLSEASTEHFSQTIFLTQHLTKICENIFNFPQYFIYFSEKNL